MIWPEYFKTEESFNSFLQFVNSESHFGPLFNYLNKRGKLAGNVFYLKDEHSKHLSTQKKIWIGYAFYDEPDFLLIEGIKLADCGSYLDPKVYRPAVFEDDFIDISDEFWKLYIKHGKDITKFFP